MVFMMNETNRVEWTRRTSRRNVRQIAKCKRCKKAHSRMGFLRAYAMARARALSDFTDEQVLLMLPAADEHYAAYRAERAP